MSRNHPAWNSRLEVKRALYGITLGLACVPILVFALGRIFLGPYEGTVGAFLATLYLDLLKGAPGAVGLVVGPYALDVLWRATLAFADRAGH